LLLEIRDNIEIAVAMINQFEVIRKQIYDLKVHLKKDNGAESILGAGKKFDDKIILVEENLYEMRSTGRGQDYSYREPSRLLTKLTYFARTVQSGDFPPTTQQFERHDAFTKQLTTYQNQMAELLKNDLPEFNKLLKENNLKAITTEIN
jgi:hypothetical protein